MIGTFLFIGEDICSGYLGVFKVLGGYLDLLRSI